MSHDFSSSRDGAIDIALRVLLEQRLGQHVVQAETARRGLRRRRRQARRSSLPVGIAQPACGPRRAPAARSVRPCAIPLDSSAGKAAPRRSPRRPPTADTGSAPPSWRRWGRSDSRSAAWRSPKNPAAQNDDAIVAIPQNEATARIAATTSSEIQAQGSLNPESEIWSKERSQESSDGEQQQPQIESNHFHGRPACAVRKSAPRRGLST